MASTAQRQHVKKLCDLFHAHAGQLLYPPDDNRQALDGFDWNLTEAELTTKLQTGKQIEFDCSETTAWWYKCAGLWPFTNPGYTGTWVDWLGKYRYTNARAAGLAAPVIFGPGTGHHMGVVWKPDPKGGNPLIAGHGRPGFDIRTLNDLAAEQSAMGHPGVAFYSIAHL
jgi:hypothetical protein